jgi:predicted cobalt transporter CbtA
MPASLLQRLIPLTTALGRNSIPLGAFVFGGSSAETVLVLYFLETILAIALTTVTIRLRAPAEHSGYHSLASTYTETRINGQVIRRHQKGNRHSLLEGFLIFSLAFAIVPGIIVALFLFGVLQTDISADTIIWGIAGIAVFQLAHFGVDIYRYPKLSPAQANDSLQYSMGRSAILFLSCFAGMILAAFVTDWFIIPFAVLKTVTDVGGVLKK